ncbi:MAG: NADH-quinone oxidoreductase subunit L, partial [Pseudomonadota bacterium]
VAAGIALKAQFVGDAYASFWGGSLFTLPDNTVLKDIKKVPEWVILAPFVMTVAGFALAWLFYIAVPSLPKTCMRVFAPIHAFLINKWYFDELYDALFVRPSMWLGRVLWKGGDQAIIDGVGPDGVAARVLDVTRGAVKVQSGYLYHYAFAMLIGIALLVTFVMLGSV